MEEKERLASNIAVLRKEARLSVEEFAEKAGVSPEVVIGWENGSIRVYTKDLMIICPILKIHEDDILSRDIAEERKVALEKMKGKEHRTNFNWYYGDKKVLRFYIIALITIVAVFLIFTLSYNAILGKIDFDQLINQGLTEEEIKFIKSSSFTYGYFIAAFPSAIFMIIELYRRFNLKIHWIFAVLCFSLIYTISTILLIPFCIYCIYRLIFLLLKFKKR